MKLVQKESLANLRQRIDLVEVISSHMELKRTGASYKGLCPFHDEKTPSFTLQRGDSHYHCFGCGAHGDAIQFLMDHAKMNFTDAIEHLAEKFHIPLEWVENGDEAKGVPKIKLKEALEQAARFYHFILLHTEEGHQALKYLYHRGLDLAFIQQFQLGLAPKAHGLFRTFMEAKGVFPDVLVEAGLAIREESGRLRDFFYDRITIPIQNATGAVIGFSARKYREETTGGKYVNTAETVLFKKSRILFGLNYSRKRIAKERKVLIVEGQIDALRLIQSGWNYTVAGQGTAFGEGHVQELLQLGVSTAHLAFDGDGAGQEAASKVGNLLQRAGVEVFVVAIPEGSDPDSLLRTQGKEAFEKLLNQSVDYLTFLVKHRSRTLDINSPAGKNNLVQSLVAQIRAWDNPVMVHESLRKLAHLAEVPESLIGIGQSQIMPLFVKRTGTAGLHTVDPDRVLESDFLRWLLLMGPGNPRFLELAEKNLPPDTLRDPLCKVIYQTFLKEKAAGNPCEILAIDAILESHEARELLSELFQQRVNKDRAEVQYADTLKKLLDRNWLLLREEIRAKLQSGHSSDDEAMLLAKQFDDLKRQPPQLK